jgi:hypothetical protein
MIPFDPTVPHNAECMTLHVNDCICHTAHTDECMKLPVNECICDDMPTVLARGRLHSVSLDDDGTGSINLDELPDDDREPLYVIADEAGNLNTVPISAWDTTQERYCVVTDSDGTETAVFDYEGNLTGGRIHDGLESLRLSLDKALGAAIVFGFLAGAGWFFYVAKSFGWF